MARASVASFLGRIVLFPLRRTHCAALHFTALHGVGDPLTDQREGVGAPGGEAGLGEDHGSNDGAHE